MFKKVITFCVLSIFSFQVKAQVMDAFVHEGEFGIGVGAGHYFGDLTAGMKLIDIKPKLSATIFFRKQFNNYIGIKIAGTFAFLGYADKYTSYKDNLVKKNRNLSFNTNIWELSINGEFNFFRFQPGFSEYRFTPYVSLGIGAFAYDPYAYLYGAKHYLRPLGTEGQQDKVNYPNLKPYSNMAMCFPIGFGLKYSLSEKINIYGEMVYRLTNTDYIDDVSGNYAPDAFPPNPNGTPSVAYLLQDRSYEYGLPIGIKGRQRGNSKQADSYITTQIGISINIGSYRCPKY
ncbi:MAG TPA: DUF6089 family protein [Chitinophagaceae bacterium]|nr:hypothetical protein [Chitinophagaceae bacterium]MCC6635546.1 hypothetical protein [Chitinophagaceae bacterium]HNE94188.1 DUF6089 family protein [Chitinophagaceae bacterium]HNJ58462.1 DUF6089 family protein [Chitinophagaceae bacterium]HNL81807.1 DUF6089 family protein [Chitinophagaceae bacterium]